MAKYLLMAMLGLSIANTWQVDGEGLPVNTNVYLIFDTQNTEDITDDANYSVITEGGVLYE